MEERIGSTTTTTREEQMADRREVLN